MRWGCEVRDAPHLAFLKVKALAPVPHTAAEPASGEAGTLDGDTAGDLLRPLLTTALVIHFDELDLGAGLKRVAVQDVGEVAEQVLAACAGTHGVVCDASEG